MEKNYKGKYRGLSKWEEKEYLKLKIICYSGLVLLGGSFIGIIIESIYFWIYSWNHDNLTEMQLTKITTPYIIPLVILLFIGLFLFHNTASDVDRFSRKIDRYKRSIENNLEG